MSLPVAASLPRAPASHVQLKASSSDADEDAPLESVPLVLVVDDFDDARELYAECLDREGFRVEQAANGQEALNLIALRKPTVVLMDLSMPVLDGWEATRRIKADTSMRDIIVIAVTGHGTEEGLRRARDAGADAVLTKPCAPDVVLARVRAALAPL